MKPKKLTKQKNQTLIIAASVDHKTKFMKLCARNKVSQKGLMALLIDLVCEDKVKIDWNSLREKSPVRSNISFIRWVEQEVLFGNALMGDPPVTVKAAYALAAGVGVTENQAVHMLKAFYRENAIKWNVEKNTFRLDSRQQLKDYLERRSQAVLDLHKGVILSREQKLCSSVRV